MNKDNFEGGVRSAVGQGERFVGAATDDKTSEVKGAYNEVAGSAQSAWGSAKDAAKEMTDTGSIPDLSRLRDDIAKLTQSVSDLAQKQVASSRDQMATAVGAAGDSLSQSAAVAQDKFAAVEGDVEARIKKNPWGARRRCRLDRVADWENELSRCARRSSYSANLPSRRAPWRRSNLRWFARSFASGALLFPQI